MTMLAPPAQNNLPVVAKAPQFWLRRFVLPVCIAGTVLVLSVEALNYALPRVLDMRALKQQLQAYIYKNDGLHLVLSDYKLRLNLLEGLQLTAKQVRLLPDADKNDKAHLLAWTLSAEEVFANVNVWVFLGFKQEGLLRQVRLKQPLMLVRGNKGLEAFKADITRLLEPEKGAPPLPFEVVAKTHFKLEHLWLQALNVGKQGQEAFLLLHVPKASWKQTSAWGNWQASAKLLALNEPTFLPRTQLAELAQGKAEQQTPWLAELESHGKLSMTTLKTKLTPSLATASLQEKLALGSALEGLQAELWLQQPTVLAKLLGQPYLLQAPPKLKKSVLSAILPKQMPQQAPFKLKLDVKGLTSARGNRFLQRLKKERHKSYQLTAELEQTQPLGVSAKAVLGAKALTSAFLPMPVQHWQLKSQLSANAKQFTLDDLLLTLPGANLKAKGRLTPLFFNEKGAWDERRFAQSPVSFEVSSLKAELAQVQPWLQPWLTALSEEGQSLPLRLLWLKGKTELQTFRLGGTLGQLHLQEGRLALKDVAAKASPKAPWLLHHGAAQLSLNPRGKLEIEQATAHLGKTGYLKAKGNFWLASNGLKLSQNQVYQGEASLKRLALNDVLPFLTPALQQQLLQSLATKTGSQPQALQLQGQGTLESELTWRGFAPQAPKLKGWLAFNDTRLSHGLNAGQTHILASAKGRLWLDGEQLSTGANPFNFSLGEGLNGQLKSKLHLPLSNKRQALTGDIALSWKQWDLSALKVWQKHLQSTLQGLALKVPPLPEELNTLKGRSSGQLAFTLQPQLKNVRPVGFLTLEGLQLAASKNVPLGLKEGKLRLESTSKAWLLKESRLLAGNGTELSLNGAGQWQNQHYKLLAEGKALDLGLLGKDVLKNIDLPPDVAPLDHLQGKANVSLTLEGQGYEQLPAIEALVQSEGLNLYFKGLNDPLHLNPTQLTLNKAQHLQLAPSSGQFGPLSFTVQGEGDLPLKALSDSKGARQLPPLRYAVQFNVEHLPLSAFRERRDFFKALVPNYDVVLWNTAGELAMNAEITPKSTQIVLDLVDAGFYAARTPLPLHGMNGKLYYSTQTGVLRLKDPLTFHVGNGDVSVSQFTYRSGQHQELTLEAHGRLTPYEFNTLYGNYFYFQPTSYPYLSDFYLNLSQHLHNLKWESPETRQHLDLSVLINAEEGSSKTLALKPRSDKPQAEGDENDDDTPMMSAMRSGEMALSDSVLNRLNTEALLLQKEPHQPEDETPLSLQLAKAPEATEIALLQALPEESVISPFPEPALPSSAAPQETPEPKPWPQANLPLFIFNRQTSYKPVGQVQVQLDLQDDALRLHHGFLKLLGQGEPIRWEGEVLHPWLQEQRKIRSRLWAETPLNLAALQPYMWNSGYRAEKGTLALDVTLLAPHPPLEAPEATTEEEALLPVPAWQLTGEVLLDGFASKTLGIQQLTHRISFKDDRVALKLGPFLASGSDVELTALSEPLPHWPLTFNESSVTGKNFYVEGFQELTTKLASLVAAPLNAGKPPSQRWVDVDSVINLPFQLRNTPVQFKDVVVNNLILNDWKGKLSLLANGYMELENMSFNMAGGTVSGRLLSNPALDNTLSMTIDAKDVKANALARLLLNAPNEVFGDLTGNIQFNTQGASSEKLVQNANGIASFEIRQGRLPSIAKIETLLTAANVIRGGVLGLNLGNLFRSMKPFDTNYFAALSGNFQIAEGMLYTQNLRSDGVNLDLDITGGLKLDSGVGDLSVTGHMSQDVSSALGRVGQLSLRRVVHYVPLLGFIPGHERGLIDYIPGLGFIPGLGGTPSTVNTFRVKLKGPLEDPSSVRDLQWLN
jgi:hypothetical protein